MRTRTRQVPWEALQGRVRSGLRPLPQCLLLLLLLTGGCRVYEDADPCLCAGGDICAQEPGVDTAPGEDTLPGEDTGPGEDTTEPDPKCTGAFYITDPEGNPAGKQPGSEGFIFDPDAFHHFSVEMEPDDWEWLQENALTEEYVPCTVVFEGYRYHGAGIRFKGAWTTLEGCFDDAGNQICPKLSMKIRFNKYDPCGRFRGVRRLVFNAAVYDFSLLRERIAYEVIRNAGLEGPRATHATLQVNGEEPSVYVLVEAPDKEFIQERWAKDEGNLYKEIWPVYDEAWNYEHALKTNESEPEVSGMMDFAAAVLAATEESFVDDVSPHMDTSAMAWYMAVARGIADDDGIMRFWCVGENDSSCINHNYYWYDDPAGLFEIIPWDMETTFYDKKAAEVMAPEWWALPESCDPIPYYIWEGIEEPGPNDLTPLVPPPCDPIIGRAVRSHPYSYLEGLADVSAAMDIALVNLETYRETISAAVIADPRLWHDIADWEENADWLGVVIEHQISVIEEVLASH